MTPREILFKAKRTDNGKWVEGYLTIEWIMQTTSFKKTYCIKGFPTTPHEEYFWVEIDPATLSQFTGLTDMNGNKIWENDIVLYDDELYVICWDDNDACFRLELEGFIDSFSNIWGRDCEVYGNIFDNKELIEVIP